MRLFRVISRTFIVVGGYPSAEVRSVYSSAPADLAIGSRVSLLDIISKVKWQSFHGVMTSVRMSTLS